MTPEEALQLALARLDDCGIPYMITGSFASNVQGVPRATQDADVIIAANQKSLDRFMKILGADFYASPEAAKEALQREGIFNIVHLETGFKIDLIIRKSRPFSRTEFSRRQKANFLGQSRWFATAEDIILAKLEWSKIGNSERQVTDALNVAKIRRNNLNWPYLQEWAEELGVKDLLERLHDEVG
jgi:hypothetical protein